MIFKISINIFLLVIIIVLINFVMSVVVNWGEECQYTAECGDHRLVCELVTVENITTKICICDKYHEWNGTLIGCVQKFEAEEIISMLQEQSDWSERIQNDADFVFFAQLIAGLIVVVVGLICTLSVSFYCYYMWKKDSDLEDMIKHLESQKLNNRPTTSRINR